MDPRRVDPLARSLAAPKSRRGFLGTLAAVGAGLLGVRAAGAQPSQAQSGNVVCKHDPGVCNAGCVCSAYPNGNSRCRPPGEVPDPILGCVAPPPPPTSTATTAMTTTTTAALLPLRSACTSSSQCADGYCCPAAGQCGIADCAPIPSWNVDSVNDCCSRCCFADEYGAPGFCCPVENGVPSGTCPEGAQLAARSGPPIVVYADGWRAT